MSDDGKAERLAQLRELLSARRDRLVCAAARILGSPDEAEDVVQDTIAAVLERLEEAPPTDAAAYLVRAVHLNALKHRQRRRSHAPLKEERLEDPARKEPADHPWGVGAIELEQAIEGLPLVQQTVIRLKYYTGLSFQEIGRSLRISQNTAASRCRYALEALRRALHKSGDKKEED